MVYVLCAQAYERPHGCQAPKSSRVSMLVSSQYARMRAYPRHDRAENTQFRIFPIGVEITEMKSVRLIEDVNRLN